MNTVQYKSSFRKQIDAKFKYSKLKYDTKTTAIWSLREQRAKLNERILIFKIRVSLFVTTLFPVN